MSEAAAILYILLIHLPALVDMYVCSPGSLHTLAILFMALLSFICSIIIYVPGKFFSQSFHSVVPKRQSIRRATKITVVIGEIYSLKELYAWYRKWNSPPTAASEMQSYLSQFRFDAFDKIALWYQVEFITRINFFNLCLMKVKF